MSTNGVPHDDSLETYQGFVVYLAHCHLDPRLARRFAEDLVQETMLKAHRGWHQFRGEGRKQRNAWLRTILLTTLADLLKNPGPDNRELQDAIGRSSKRLDEFVNEEQTTPGTRAVRNERALALEEALQKLDERERTAVVLKHYHDWSYAQIGERLGASLPAVAGLLHRGREKLLDHLSDLR